MTRPQIAYCFVAECLFLAGCLDAPDDCRRTDDNQDAQDEDAPVGPGAQDVHECLCIFKLRYLTESQCCGIVGKVHQHGQFQ